MIVFSQDASFTLQRVESGYRGVSRSLGSLGIFHSIRNFNGVKVDKDSRLLLKKIWVQFKGGPGLEPFGQTWIYPDHLIVRLMPYKIPIFLNDWSKPIELNKILPVQDQNEAFFIELSADHIFYDGLNIQEIYNGAACRLVVWAEIDGVLYENNEEG